MLRSHEGAEDDASPPPFLCHGFAALLGFAPCRAQAKPIVSSHPRVIRDFPTMKPSRTHPDDFDPDAYHFGTRYKIVVGIDYDAVKQPIRVDWREAGRVHSQLLDLPQVPTNDVDPDLPTVWWPSDEYIGSFIPQAMCWPGRARPTIIIVAGRPSGVYDIYAPVIFELSDDRWHCVSPNPSYLEFTDRGAFNVRGNRIYVWDYEMNWNQSHGAAQRYYLHIFDLRHGHLRLTCRKMTQRRYEALNDPDDTGSASRREKVPRAYDPLRELGLRWRWWGQSAQ